MSKGEPLMMVMEFLEKGDLRRHLLNYGENMKCEALISICENVSRKRYTTTYVDGMHFTFGLSIRSPAG